MLHAMTLGFDHPRTGRPVRYVEPPAADFLAMLDVRGAWPMRDIPGTRELSSRPLDKDGARATGTIQSETIDCTPVDSNRTASARALWSTALRSPAAHSERPVLIARLLAPLVPANIFAIGKNYAAHALEIASLLRRPLIFMKATSSLNDPGSDPLPASAPTEVDFEGESLWSSGSRHGVSRGQGLDFVLAHLRQRRLGTRLPAGR